MKWMKISEKQEMEKSTRQLSGVLEMFYNLICMIITWMQIFGKTHQPANDSER